MNHAKEIFELATVDLVDLSSTDRDLAKEHAVTILSNYDVAVTRIKFLQKLRSKDNAPDNENWADEVQKFRSDDLAHVILEEHIPFSRIIDICSSPFGIASAFNASLKQFESEVADELFGDALPEDFVTLRRAIDAGQFGFRKLDVPCVPPLAGSPGNDSGTSNTEWRVMLGVIDRTIFAGNDSGTSNTEWLDCRYDHPTGKVFLKIAEANVPHGLVRVVLIDEKTQQVFTWFPQLDLDSGFWFGEAKLSTLRGDNPPEHPISVIATQPAGEENRAFFDNDDVRELVNGLSEESEQARRAKCYLKGK